MAKSKSRSPQEVKSALKKLKAKGLYSGDLRKSPTDYAKRLTRKYADVVSGRASVVAVPQHATKRGSGLGKARLEAKDIAAAYSSQIRVKGKHLIVQTVTPEDRARLLPKQKIVEIERVRNADTIERIRLEKVGQLHLGQDGTAAMQFRDLRNGEAYYVPFIGKNGGVRYTAFGSKAELYAALNKYQHFGDLSGNIVISRTMPKRKRKGNAL